jgi:hypothetical protein
MPERDARAVADGRRDERPGRRKRGWRRRRERLKGRRRGWRGRVEARGRGTVLPGLGVPYGVDDHYSQEEESSDSGETPSSLRRRRSV